MVGRNDDPRIEEIAMPRAKLGLAIPAALLIGLPGCASSGSQSVVPQPWVPGSYEFQSVIHGETITGVIEVWNDGPMAVTTSLGRCMARQSEAWRPWHRVRTFDCAGDHRVEVSVGSRTGPPVGGWMRNTTMVTRELVSRTCVEYEVTESGQRVCSQWREEKELVTRPVVESARILLVASVPATSP
jgi:hypothetical protein